MKFLVGECLSGIGSGIGRKLTFFDNPQREIVPKLSRSGVTSFASTGILTRASGKEQKRLVEKWRRLDRAKNRIERSSCACADRFEGEGRRERILNVVFEENAGRGKLEK